MDACEFFLQEYDTVRFIVNDLFLKGLNDDQIRHQPEAGLNSIAWYLWHTARWQDFANTLIATDSERRLASQDQRESSRREHRYDAGRVQRLQRRGERQRATRLLGCGRQLRP